MSRWSPEVELELTLLMKDWLKHQGRTQADLGKSLHTGSSRINALLEVLENEYQRGGMQKVAARLCAIEKEWSQQTVSELINQENADPFGQLDLLLKEIKHDCDA